ncbi:MULTISPECIES: DivIVA domain-containing protein [Lacticaseibacillus]|uniref:DivIVA domain-containing protein n=1 Tax=Lacticaseibacillus hegangensis TaxID=2486010 RepID=A0ABW4CZM8_9LACO|nr:MULTISPECIES: DivIVA domain-containing protein [Lacticaseibacillus]
MALSPLDIHNKEFNHRMRGLDEDQVNDFLAQIIKDYSASLKKNEEMEKELKELQDKNKYFNDLKDALNQSIIVAQEAADKVKKNADDEAALIQSKAEKTSQDMLTSATEKANQIVKDASDKAKNITVQTEDLKRQTRVFRQRLQVMLESQLEVVKSPEWKELLASTTESAEYLDPAQEKVPESAAEVDNEPADSVNSEATEDTDGETRYTEIVFPTDEPEDSTASTADYESDGGSNTSDAPQA